jgi:hypothetical protein
MRVRLAAAAPLLAAGLLLWGCDRAGGQPGGSTPYNPVATVDDIMEAIVIPSSQAVFDAVVYSNGELVQAPRNDEDWSALRIHALGVAEAGNLLMMPPRARDGDWTTLARALNERAIAAADAARTKDVDALLAAGGELYNVCAACHEKYIPQ